MKIVVTSLAYQLCAPVGGIDQGANLSASGALTMAGNVSANLSTPASPSPSPFTGAAAGVVVWGCVWMFVAGLWGFAWVTVAW